MTDCCCVVESDTWWSVICYLLFHLNCYSSLPQRDWRSNLTINPKIYCVSMECPDAKEQWGTWFIRPSLQSTGKCFSWAARFPPGGNCFLLLPCWASFGASHEQTIEAPCSPVLSHSLCQRVQVPRTTGNVRSAVKKTFHGIVPDYLITFNFILIQAKCINALSRQKASGEVATGTWGTHVASSHTVAASRTEV